MTIKTKDGGSTIMTEEQINALPLVCRVIVLQARYLEEIACAPVASFNEFKKQRNILRGYVSDAARIFMPLSVRDGPLATV